MKTDMNDYSTYTFPNGLRLIYQYTSSQVSYAGFTVNVGSRDEKIGEEGLAHFVEHLLFKGTLHRKSRHILNCLGNVGGELNAYTSKEETVIYSVFLSKYLSRAVDLMSDLILHSQFPASEIKRETEVILDEINSYHDNPSELIYDDFEDLLFEHHALGHNILGNCHTLPTFTSTDGLQFLHENYVPSRMVFFFRGSTPFKQVTTTVSRIWGISPEKENVLQRTPPNEYTPFTRHISLNTSQAHVLVGNRAYNMFNPHRAALFLLNNLLGGPNMNNRLNIALREKTGYVYTVESSVTTYTDTGTFTIYFATAPSNVERCLSLLHRELERLRKTPLTTLQLSMAKRQFMGQIAIDSENSESMALGMGKAFLHYKKYESLQETFAHIEAVTALELCDVANEIFDESNLSRLIYE